MTNVLEKHPRRDTNGTVFTDSLGFLSPANEVGNTLEGFDGKALKLVCGWLILELVFIENAPKSLSAL